MVIKPVRETSPPNGLQQDIPPAANAESSKSGFRNSTAVKSTDIDDLQTRIVGEVDIEREGPMNVLSDLDIAMKELDAAEHAARRIMIASAYAAAQFLQRDPDGPASGLNEPSQLSMPAFRRRNFPKSWLSVQRKVLKREKHARPPRSERRLKQSASAARTATGLSIFWMLVDKRPFTWLQIGRRELLLKRSDHHSWSADQVEWPTLGRTNIRRHNRSDR